MTPIWLVSAMVVLFAVAGVPFAHLVDGEGWFFHMTKNVDSSYVWRAYAATLYACAVLVLLYRALGTHLAMRRYLERREDEHPERFHSFLWIGTLAASAALSAGMLVQSGGTIPLLSARGLSFADVAVLRSEFSSTFHPVAYYGNLFGCAPLALGIALLHLKQRKAAAVTISLANLVFVSSFSLAKSHVAQALFLVLLLVATLRSVPIRHLVYFALCAMTISIPWYIVTSIHQELPLSGLVLGRIYGQWTGLPYFFEVFETSSVQVSSLLPPYLGRDPLVDESAARLVMRVLVGDSQVDGRQAGEAVTFFIGEAFAVGGLWGVACAPFIVGLELHLIALCVSRWRKNLLTAYVYAWFMLKLMLGLLSGFSAFLISSFTITLAMAAVVTLLAGRPDPRKQVAG